MSDQSRTITAKGGVAPRSDIERWGRVPQWRETAAEPSAAKSNPMSFLMSFLMPFLMSWA
jgi:hypothetical protein